MTNENTVNCPDCYGMGYLEDWDGTKKKCGMCNGLGFLSINKTNQTVEKGKR